MNNKEKLLLVSNILKNILNREYLSSYKLSKIIGLSEKTVKKNIYKRSAFMESNKDEGNKAWGKKFWLDLFYFTLL